MATGYQSKKNYGKKTTETTGDTGKTKPAMNLVFNPDPNGDGSELIRVTGLFANEGKNYYSVKLKEDISIPAGAKLLVFMEK